jgi:5-methylthioadenosine/S-adenosylhomocysteine deaminase
MVGGQSGFYEKESIMDCGNVRQADVLIKNGMILTMDEGGRCIDNGGVAVADHKIAALGDVAQMGNYHAGEIIDAQGKLIMPGLVNAHNHMPMSLFRGLADDLPLEQWLQEHIFPAEAKFINPQSVRLGARLSIAEMLLSGTTTCCDGYFLASDIADTVLQSGLRSVLGQGVIDFPAPGVPDPRENIAVAADFVRHWSHRSPLISPSIFCHAAYTCSPETLQAAKGAASALGVLFQIHVAETQFEANQCRQTHGCSPVRQLAQLGLLDQQTLLVHGVWVDESDIDVIAHSEAKVIHCPESNMKLASGVSPVPQMIDRGVVVALGTDGCASNNDLDLFGEMDMAAKLHKAHRLEPAVMGAKTVVRMATMDGARALGLDDTIGSLEVGKQADLIMIDINQPHLVPMYHPESHLVYAVKGRDVQDVMIAGQWVVRDRRILTLDLDSILDQVRQMGTTIADLNHK